MTLKILVTGGMGLLGGRIGQAIAAHGNDVMLGSRRKQCSPSWLSTAEVVQMNWMSKESLISACKEVDAIVHLAAMNDAECLRDPVAALEVNGVYTARLLEAAIISGVKRFLYFSTAHIYGSPLAGQIDESTIPRCKHPYATSHRAAEDVVLAARDKLSTIVLRLSNAFGRPTHAAVNSWMLLINDLCRQAITQGSLTLRTSGLQKRDFVTLHDVGRIVNHMLSLSETKIGNGIFNVGSGKSMQIIEMAKIIQSRNAVLMGYTPRIIRPAPAPNESNPDFEYKVGKLLSSGFTLIGNYQDEIDGILKMCNSTWGLSKYGSEYFKGVNNS